VACGAWLQAIRFMASQVGMIAMFWTRIGTAKNWVSGIDLRDSAAGGTFPRRFTPPFRQA